jgi:hypothetical protein
MFLLECVLETLNLPDLDSATFDLLFHRLNLFDWNNFKMKIAETEIAMMICGD